MTLGRTWGGKSNVGRGSTGLDASGSVLGRLPAFQSRLSMDLMMSRGDRHHATPVTAQLIQIIQILDLKFGFEVWIRSLGSKFGFKLPSTSSAISLESLF